MKRIFCTSLAAIVLLSGTALNAKADTITNFKGQSAEVYTSTDGNEGPEGARTTAVASFIEDPHNSDLIALVSLKGFIPADLTKDGDYYFGYMRWPNKYTITVENSGDSNVKIIQSVPNNKVESVKVSDSIGYTIGGNVSASKKNVTGGINGKVDVKHTISYEQKDFKTIQLASGINKAQWDIEFVRTRDGYDIHSYNAIYGNEMFLKSRLYNTGNNNITDENNLPPLISGGFNPDMAIALKAPKGTDKSYLKLSYRVHQHMYTIRWRTTQWYGENAPITYNTTSSDLYEVDWKNRTIKVVETNS